MDNVSHTLIGITLGKALTRKSDDASTQKAIYWASVLGSNAPDLDAFLGSFSESKKLFYLLHHRGYTHTFLWMIPLAVVAGFLGSRLGMISWKKSWSRLSLVGIIASLFHIFADFCNDYGVHPLAPFYNRWFYGDTTFIVEPMIWFALIPDALWSTKVRWGQWSWRILGIGMLTLCLAGSYLIWPAKIWVALWALLMLALQWKKRIVLIPIVSFFSVVIGFAAASQTARQLILERYRAHSEEGILQLALSPAPANPFCWKVAVASAISKEGTYFARVGAVSLWPSLSDPKSCMFRVSRSRLAPLQVPAFSSDSKVYWEGEFRGNLNEAHQLSQRFCEMDALLHFARIPFWFEREGRVFAGDLRYDHEPNTNFSKFELSGGGQCLRFIPPWTPPVSQLYVK